MKTHILTLLTISAVALSHADDAAKDNNAFAFALMDSMPESKDNFAFSPFSIWTALAMTSAGAEGATLKEMRETLHLPMDDDKSHALAGDWAEQLKKSKGVELRVANRLWGEKSIPFKDPFLKLTKKHYGAGLEASDFIGNPGKSRKVINSWIEDNTNGKIKDLLQQGDITKETRLVLTNAIYFLGKWASPFDAESTAPREFTTARNEKIKVPTMLSEIKKIAYLENDHLQAVKLPYQGDDTAMIVVLPRKADALNQKGFMDAAKFAELFKGLKKEPELLVQLPKFEVSSRLGLASQLAALGMKLAFTDKAEFGRMSTEPLKISNVIHQAWVKVEEKGTEAAAATAVIVQRTLEMPKQEPKKFIANHPFLFFIVDNKNGGVIFAGRVMDPR